MSIMMTRCGEYSVSACVCGDCEALDVPELEHLRAEHERRKHESFARETPRSHIDFNPVQFGYPSYRG